MNSAAFGFANEIHSVRHALSILGEREVRRWGSSGCYPGGGSKPLERTCSCPRWFALASVSCLSSKVKHGDSDLFLFGTCFPLMDSILEIPMAEVLDSVPSTRRLKEVLLGRGTRPCVRSINLCWRRNRATGRAVAELAKSLSLRDSPK